MKIMFAARMGRYDLLFSVVSLARLVTKWTVACDKRLFRLICYMHATQDSCLESIAGDHIKDCKLVAYTDADWAGDNRTSKSTSGAFVVLVGPNTCAPISALCKGQTVISHYTTESEIVALDTLLRTEAIPILWFFEQLIPHMSSIAARGVHTACPAKEQTNTRTKNGEIKGRPVNPTQVKRRNPLPRNPRNPAHSSSGNLKTRPRSKKNRKV